MIDFRQILEATATSADVKKLNVAKYSRCNDSATVVRKARKLKKDYDEDKYSGTDIEFAMLAKRGLIFHCTYVSIKLKIGSMIFQDKL